MKNGNFFGMLILPLVFLIAGCQCSNGLDSIRFCGNVTLGGAPLANQTVHFEILTKIYGDGPERSMYGDVVTNEKGWGCMSVLPPQASVDTCAAGLHDFSVSELQVRVGGNTTTGKIVKHWFDEDEWVLHVDAAFDLANPYPYPPGSIAQIMLNEMWGGGPKDPAPKEAVSILDQSASPEILPVLPGHGDEGVDRAI